MHRTIAAVGFWVNAVVLGLDVAMWLATGRQPWLVGAGCCAVGAAVCYGLRRAG